MLDHNHLYDSSAEITDLGSLWSCFASKPRRSLLFRSQRRIFLLLFFCRLFCPKALQRCWLRLGHCFCWFFISGNASRNSKSCWQFDCCVQTAWESDAFRSKWLWKRDSCCSYSFVLYSASITCFSSVSRKNAWSSCFVCSCLLDAVYWDSHYSDLFWHWKRSSRSPESRWSHFLPCRQSMLFLLVWSLESLFFRKESLLQGKPLRMLWDSGILLIQDLCWSSSRNRLPNPSRLHHVLLCGPTERSVQLLLVSLDDNPWRLHWRILWFSDWRADP